MRGRIFIFLLLVCSLNAATYYIDWTGGNDANSGASTGLAKKRHPYMTGYTGSYSHSNGDIFIFKGGETWPSSCYPFVPLLGGSSGSRDQYKTDATWYTGGAFTKPIFDGQYAVAFIMGVWDVQYITIDNIEICHSQASDANTGACIGIDDGTDNIIFSNLYLHGWRVTGTDNGAHGGIICPSQFTSKTWTMVIDHCEFENSENGQPLTSAGSFVVGCTYRIVTVGSTSFTSIGASANTVGVVFICTGVGTGSGTAIGQNNGLAVRQVDTIQNSTFHDLASAVLFTGDYNNNTLYNVSYPTNNEPFDGGTYHCNGVYLSSCGNRSIYYIRNSIFHDVGAGANMAYPNPAFVTQYVYNCLFYGNMSTQDAINIDPFNGNIPGSTGTCYVYNNTIVNYTSGTPGIHISNRFGSPKLAVYEGINNHVIGTSATVSDASGSTVTSITETTNLVQTPATANGQGYVLGNQYAPTSTSSSTYNAGTSESGTFTTDILGTARPQASVWDIGAYEFVTTSAGGSSVTGKITITGKVTIR